jgi:hypothetical protein
MNDKTSILCQECDNVFHKSVAKKCHIRIPVFAGASKSPLTPSESQEKLHLSRENSASVGNDESASSDGSDATPAAVLKSLLQELNEFCRLPMTTHGILDSSYNLRTPKHHLGDDLAARIVSECAHCVLLAGLRGLLDDREVSLACLDFTVTQCRAYLGLMCEHRCAAWPLSRASTPRY